MKNKNILCLSSLLLGVGALTLSSCGFGYNGDSTGPASSSVPPATSSQATSSQASEPGTSSSTSDKEYDPDIDVTINGLQNDLEWDEGEIVFDGVELTMWSVINQPDNVAMHQLINDYNSFREGEIHISMEDYSQETYYGSLESTFKYDKTSMPDVMLMHCEKIANYGYLDYMYPLNEILTTTKSPFDFSKAYENIDRTNILKSKGQEYRFAIPIDTHGFLYSIRQDIVKKNGLGFENNTRFIPNNRAELQHLLTDAVTKAKAGQLLYRDITQINAKTEVNKHAWKTLPADQADSFAPLFSINCDYDGISALYSNGGKLANAAQDEIIFGNDSAINQLLEDVVNRSLAGEMYTKTDKTNTAMFSEGLTIMFTEGPWWAAQTYDPQYNNIDLRNKTVTIDGTEVATGCSDEDVNDPVYSKPYVSTNPSKWYARDDAPAATASKWYGNGHSLALSRTVTKMSKAAAFLDFAYWLTQKEEEGKYNVTTHCLTGHLPAWKNVYENQDYKTRAASNITLKALGDPANIMTLESLSNVSIYYSCIQNVYNAALEMCRGTGEKSVDKAKKSRDEVIASAQAELDLVIG